MTTKSSGTIAVTRQKILAQISTAQKQADLAKKVAKTAKAGFKSAKQKFKDAKRAAKNAKKALKVLKTALAATTAKKSRPKLATSKAPAKQSRSVVAPTVVREPEVTVKATSDSVPPIITMV